MMSNPCCATVSVSWRFVFLSIAVLCASMISSAGHQEMSAQQTAHFPTAPAKTDGSTNDSGLGQLQIEVLDTDDHQIPCRIHLYDAKGNAVKTNKYPFWKDHFVCDGRAALDLPPGSYSWEVEKGPEFERKKGKVEVRENKVHNVQIKIERIADLFSSKWVSGDMHVHRQVKDAQLLMLAEDIHFAPVITWWNRPAKNVVPEKQTVFTFDKNRLFTKLAGEDEREGGALLFFGLDRPLDLTVKSREYPSPMSFVRQAREINPGVWIDIEKPFWWDVPVWLASNKMNSIGIANNHMCRSQMLPNEAWGKPRDFTRLPNPRGNGFWTQEIYYHILNAGIRMPPSAGSASGVLPNPVGYNRIYVHCGRGFDRDMWFDGLRKGNSFVTNGPLLLVKANRKISGNIFSFQKKMTLSFQAELTSLDHVPALELVFNGKVVKKIACKNVQDQKLNWEFEVDEPGWFLVRAISNVQQTFRFASTAPWYVENKDGEIPVSKNSSQFFLNWTKERMERVKKNVSNKTERSHVLKHHDQALQFWEKKVAGATRK